MTVRWGIELFLVFFRLAMEICQTFKQTEEQIEVRLFHLKKAVEGFKHDISSSGQTSDLLNRQCKVQNDLL